MKTRLLLPLFFIAALIARAEQPKEYQVTGPVLALTDAVITVDKNGKKWEIGRAGTTKVDGKLAVGSRVTVYYRMGATAIEVKDAAAKADDKKADDKKADKKGKK
jgi:hypothetical protein